MEESVCGDACALNHRKEYRVNAIFNREDVFGMRKYTKN